MVVDEVWLFFLCFCSFRTGTLISLTALLSQAQRWVRRVKVKGNEQKSFVSIAQGQRMAFGVKMKRYQHIVGHSDSTKT